MPEWVELEGRHTPVLYNGRVSTDHLITFLYYSLHPALDSLSGQLIFFVRRRNYIREEKRNRRCFLVAKYELGGEQKIKPSIRTTCTIGRRTESRNPLLLRSFEGNDDRINIQRGEGEDIFRIYYFGLDGGSMVQRLNHVLETSLFRWIITPHYARSARE